MVAFAVAALAAGFSPYQPGWWRGAVTLAVLGGIVPMIAIAERPVMAMIPMPRPEPGGAAARELALAFLRYASACWRGEACAAHFATRLGAYWRPQLPAMPTRPADAFSPHGAGGRGIAWYETWDAVLGYVPERRSGYYVPLAAVSGLAKCVSVEPGEKPLDAAGAWWAASIRVPHHGAAA